jgi:hypothetical protein
MRSTNEELLPFKFKLAVKGHTSSISAESGYLAERSKEEKNWFMGKNQRSIRCKYVQYKAGSLKSQGLVSGI